MDRRRKRGGLGLDGRGLGLCLGGLGGLLLLLRGGLGQVGHVPVLWIERFERM